MEEGRDWGAGRRYDAGGVQMKDVTLWVREGLARYKSIKIEKGGRGEKSWEGNRRGDG